MLDSEAVDKLTLILASVENELLEVTADLEAAHDIEHIRGSDLPSVDDRQEVLKALIGALANNDMPDVWISQVAPVLLDNHERAEQYIDMDGDEWENQIARWADGYRSAGATGSDRALAEAHVSDTFGVDLDTFENRVVNFDRGQEAERMFAGNFRTVHESIRKAATAAREDQGDA
jgi:hypothetical protein